MVEQIPWAAIGALTPSGMLMLAVWLILSGKLVPKATLDRETTRGDQWRDTAAKKQEIIQVQAETIRDQAVISETVAKVMAAVQDANRAGEST
ncbi:hypothetical protein [Glutamicibacter sp. ZJUTW]|uniref:hypothetical protein n=1 Tax=Glutamicibacter sp. ZJUTW TaxID=1155384 RepID=UPI0011F2D44C|nr:hypothetical protein [Glutamicibacter sp. ZJUTW]QEP06197.1 hypothetical protein F0M17_02440 [Glutamicibacter sp. ZJUTW]